MSLWPFTTLRASNRAQFYLNLLGGQWSSSYIGIPFQSTYVRQRFNRMYAAQRGWPLFEDREKGA